MSPCNSSPCLLLPHAASGGQFVWSYHYTAKICNFLPRKLWTDKAKLVCDTVPRDLALFYKYFLVDITTLTLSWSWLGNRAPIGFCWNHSRVGLAESTSWKRTGHTSSLLMLSAPFLQAAPPDHQLFSFLFPWFPQILLTYFRFPFSVGKGNLGPCSTQLNPGPAGKEGASSWGHWVGLVNPSFLFSPPDPNHHSITYTAVALWEF